MNTDTVSVLSENTSYLKKINVSFSVEFFLGKYSFRFDTFEHTSYLNEN